MRYLGTMFSEMLRKGMFLVREREISPENIPESVVSVVDHADTAAVLTSILGFKVVPGNRGSIELSEEDVFYFAQYRGPRLPEGATELPEGAFFDFYEVMVREPCKGCNGPTEECPFCGELYSWIEV